MIVGYERSTAVRAGIGRLLLAARKGTKLVYVGGVGTGFNERTAHELRDKLDGLNIVKPKLIDCEGPPHYCPCTRPAVHQQLPSNNAPA